MQTIHHKKIIAHWLFIGVGMLIVQVLLGGITRLSGSGLSITEWEPVMGALPPMTEEAWLAAFDKYKQIAQYKYLNNHFTVNDFKFIFFWEWFHRLWARLMGLVFFFPFIYFLVKRWFDKQMILPLVALFILGGMQGLIGWIMVKSGLNDENLYVSHIRLAIHFMAAMLLVGYTWLFGLSLVTDERDKVNAPSLKNSTIIIFILLCVQLVYGAFMAGLKAAGAAPTWPDINGEIIPSGIFNHFFDTALHNALAVHFIHRTLAYTIFILIAWWWFKAGKQYTSAAFKKYKNYVAVLVVVQVMLGIITVISSPGIVPGSFGIFEWLALMHQLTGMLLFLGMLSVIYFLREMV